MSRIVTRRVFAGAAMGLTVGSAAAAEDPPKPKGPIEAPFERDYDAPKFQPSWRSPQINRVKVADFVIYAHADLAMVKRLLEKEPRLLNATMDWGAGDWESGLGGASHMGRRDIVEYLLEHGARIDVFCAAMLGQLQVVEGLLKLQPKLIDAKGPHGISLHAHAKAGGKEAEGVLQYLQSIKKVDVEPKAKKSKEAMKKGK